MDIAQKNKNFSAFLGINLLPPEIILQRKQSSKMAVINVVSVFVLIVLVFCASATFALRFSQNLELKKAENQIVMAEEKINKMQSTEGEIVILKDRLKLIQKLSGSDAERRGIFNLIVYLVPLDIQISELSVDKNNDVTMTLTSLSLASLENFFESLANKEKTISLIKKVNLNSLALGRDSTYRVSLKISSK